MIFLSLFVSLAPLKGAAHLCLSDLPQWSVHADAGKTQERMALYKERLGASMLRASLPWGLLEPREGHWDEAPMRGYFEALKASGLRCKLILSVVMDPPVWYLEKHPELRMQDQFGARAHALAPWSRAQWPYLEKKTRALLELAKKMGVWDITDEVVIDLGPAGEPLYPPNWTLGEGDGLNGGQRGGEEGFFIYGESARADFVAAMREKHGTIAQATRAWGTRYKDWDAIAMPQPGTQPGAFWEDVLLWYRDAKRAFNLWRMESVLALIKEQPSRDVAAIVYLPGIDFSEEDWQQAVQTGGGNALVRLMIDNAYLIEQAARLGCLLQMTGAQDPAVCEHYLRLAKKSAVPPDKIWLENSGDPVSASNPGKLVALVKRHKLRGLDYTHTRWLLNEDTLTPKPPLFGELAEAWKRLTKSK